MDDMYDDIMKAICIISHIDNNINTYNINIVKYLINSYNFVTTIKELNLKKYKKGNHCNYFYDVYDKKYKLLLNIGKNIKHKPCVYGKMKKINFCDTFDILYVDESKGLITNKCDNIKQNNLNIKKYIMNNIKILLEILHKNIFRENTIVILFNEYNIINDLFKYTIYIFDNFDFKYELDLKKIKYTRNLNNWRISNTLKYNNIIIGNFLIGENVEFSYNLNKYIYILDRLDSI